MNVFPGTDDSNPADIFVSCGIWILCVSVDLGPTISRSNAEIVAGAQGQFELVIDPSTVQSPSIHSWLAACGLHISSHEINPALVGLVPPAV
jgi:hypothetical protein